MCMCSGGGGSDDDEDSEDYVLFGRRRGLHSGNLTVGSYFLESTDKMSMAVVLVTGGFDQKIRFWEATSGSCIRTIRYGDSQVNTVRISRDKLLIAAGGNPIVRIYDVNSSHDTALMTLEGHVQNVTGLGFQQDGKWVYSCSEDGTMKVWDMRTGSSQETELITGDHNGSVKVWDMAANACRVEHIPLPEVPVRSTSVSGNGSLLAVGSHKGQVFTYNSAEVKSNDWTLDGSFRAHDNYLLRCAVSPDMSTIVTTSADHSIRQWKVSSQRGEQLRCLTHHQRWVWDAVFSADSSYLVSASSDQSAKLWDLRSGEVIRNYMGHSLAVTCVDLNDNNFS